LPLNKYLRSESGQSVILISMVLLSFLMFFGFAVNTAVLVTAKISVQSAADAAAYAGAATQARQLNAISFLNYDMRRQFKKFVYRYDFLGNIASYNFPNSGFSKSYYTSNVVSSKTNTDLKIPVVCVPLSGKTSNQETCLYLNQPNTVNLANDMFPNGGATQITTAALQYQTQILDMIKGRCEQNSGVNLFSVMMWLFRGDPDPNSMSAMLNTMVTGLPSSDQAYVLGTMNNLLRGLGLYPRNVITHLRIKTLEKFLNVPAQKDLDEDKVESFEKSNTAEKYERTIQAFKSALSNLNNEVMKHSEVTMQELQNDRQITLLPITPSFNIYVQYMLGGQNLAGATYCNSDIIPISANYALVGVKPDYFNVHYAVRVKAKAKLLFLPLQDGLELEAFAAAKPFGSRIGPSLSESDFVTSIKPVKPSIYAQELNDCASGPSFCNVPNLQINGSNYFLSPAYLQTLSDLSFVPNPTGNGKSFQFPGAIAHAMAPQPAEVGLYNILPPPPTLNQGSIDQYKNVEYIHYAQEPEIHRSSVYRFYAPIFENGQANIPKIVDDALDTVFPQTATQNNAFGLDPIAIRSDLSIKMTDYIKNKLVQGGAASENGETQTFAAIDLPMAPPPPSTNGAASAPLNASPQGFWLTTASETNSSWAPDRGVTGNSTIDSRFGFSVKFVAMQQLINQGTAASDDDMENVTH
jgi:hypothetical protein